MTNRLEIKVTISEDVTPALYRTMTGIVAARDRASLFKQIAEAYLCGKSLESATLSNVLLNIATSGPEPQNVDIKVTSEALPTMNSREAGVADVQGIDLSPGKSQKGFKLDVIGDEFASF